MGLFSGGGLFGGSEGNKGGGFFGGLGGGDMSFNAPGTVGGMGPGYAGFDMSGANTNPGNSDGSSWVTNPNGGVSWGNYGASGGPSDPVKQQQAENQRAWLQQVKANRPQQTTHAATNMWKQDENGNWFNELQMNPELSGISDNLLQQLRQSTANPLDPSFGAVQEVQDAMMSRLRPELDRNREKEIQRLRNQGIYENTEAFDRAMTRGDQASTDANQQALLGATGAYNDIFNRSVVAREQPLKDYGNIMNIAGGSMPSFMGADQPQTADILADQRATEASKAASKENTKSGLFGLASKVLPFFL